MQMVRLGADTDARLMLPPRAQNEYLQLLDRYKLGGKSAEELASLSTSKELVALIKDFEEPKARLEKVHCRCGSRLPWKQCH